MITQQTQPTMPRHAPRMPSSGSNWKNGMLTLGGKRVFFGRPQDETWESYWWWVDDDEETS